MQADVVSEAEVVGVQDSLIRIPDDFVVRDAPGFVTDDAFAVLAGAVGAVPVAMRPKRSLRGVHDLVSLHVSQWRVRRLLEKL